MNPEPTALSLLPPLLAIGLAIWTRQVYLSLAAGIFLGWWILAGNPLAGLADSIDGVVAVLGDAGNASVILFTLAIGALIATLEASGGVAGFVRWLETRGWVDSPRGARMIAWIVGTVIFIESNITVLVAGALSRPLFDRFRVSREKLAYLIDSTSAPVCILIPLNAWGAYILGILGSTGVESPLALFLESIAFNFYAILAWLLAGWVAITGFSMGPMVRADERARLAEPEPMIDLGAGLEHEEVHGMPGREKASTMILPIVTMILMMPIGLYVTGDGVFADGSGSTSVLWAVLAALAVAWALLMLNGASVEQLTTVGLKGAGGLVSLAILMLLALALGSVARTLGTGAYVAQVAEGVFPPFILLPLVFALSAGIAFSTGTSWGTFAIMVPIAVPTGAAMGLPLAPFLAAALSGGIFGDHSSPISDTTIISSMSASVDHIEHVRTQLPYALAAGGVAAIGFAITGLFLG